MAVQTAPASHQPQVGVLQQKKSRKNPARRKAAQAKLQAQNPQQAFPAKRSPPKLNSDKSGKLALPDRSTLQQRSALNSCATQPCSDIRPNLAVSKASAESKAGLGYAASALVTGGLVGCAAGAAIMLGVSMWYDFSGVKSAILTAKAAKLCVDNLTEEIISSLNAGTYSTDEALDMLRRTTLAYASAIPNGTAFVERCFREINLTRKLRGPEVEKVLHEAYGELNSAGSRKASAEEMRILVVKHLTKLSSFAYRAMQDVVARNPGFKPFTDSAMKSLQGRPKPKVPTIKLDLHIRNKQAVVGAA